MRVREKDTNWSERKTRKEKKAKWRRKEIDRWIDTMTKLLLECSHIFNLLFELKMNEQTSRRGVEAMLN